MNRYHANKLSRAARGEGELGGEAKKSAAETGKKEFMDKLPISDPLLYFLFFCNRWDRKRSGGLGSFIRSR